MILTRLRASTFNRSRRNLNGPIRNTFIDFPETSQTQSCPRVPQSSLTLSYTCAEKLWVEIATNSRYYGLILRTPLLVPTALFYCSSKSRYKAFFSITSLQNLLIMIHSFNRGFAVRNPYIQNMP